LRKQTSLLKTPEFERLREPQLNKDSPQVKVSLFGLDTDECNQLKIPLTRATEAIEPNQEQSMKAVATADVTVTDAEPLKMAAFIPPLRRDDPLLNRTREQSKRESHDSLAKQNTLSRDHISDQTFTFKENKSSKRLLVPTDGEQRALLELADGCDLRPVCSPPLPRPAVSRPQSPKRSPQ